MMEMPRIYTDEAGESHFDTIEVTFHINNFAPPAQPFATADILPAARYTFLAPAAGWYGEWHPSPRRQILFILKGIWEVTVSDGETRRFAPGDIMLGEDTSGKGHVTHIASEEDGLAGVVQLP